MGSENILVFGKYLAALWKECKIGP